MLAVRLPNSPFATRYSRPSELRCCEGVAARYLARLQASVEPALALRGGAVGERVRYHVALRPALQRVVADRRGGAQRSLDVARVNERRLALRAQGRVLAVSPDAGEAVGLQLDLDLDLVGVGTAAGALLRLLRLRQDAEQVLHVVADLVRDHIGLREQARLAAGITAAEAGGDLVEERGVEIDLLVDRAVERPHRALRRAAATRVGHAAVHHQHRRTIGLAGLGEHRLPLLLGAAEHPADELARIVGRCPDAPAARRRLHLWLARAGQHFGAADQQARIDAERPTDEAENDDRADAEAARTAWKSNAAAAAEATALPAAILNIAALLQIIQAHDFASMPPTRRRRRIVVPEPTTARFIVRMKI